MLYIFLHHLPKHQVFFSGSQTLAGFGPLTPNNNWPSLHIQSVISYLQLFWNKGLLTCGRSRLVETFVFVLVFANAVILLFDYLINRLCNYLFSC